TFTETYDTSSSGASKTLTPTGSVSDGNSGNNYVITFVSAANGTITKASLSVNAVAASKTYGANDPAFTWTYSGFQGTDTAGNSNITGSANCIRVSGETVASSPYAITCAPGGLSSPNYSFTTGNTANISEKQRGGKVNAVPASQSYGTNDTAFT